MRMFRLPSPWCFKGVAVTQHKNLSVSILIFMNHVRIVFGFVLFFSWELLELLGWIHVIIVTILLNLDSRLSYIS